MYSQVQAPMNIDFICTQEYNYFKSLNGRRHLQFRICLKFFYKDEKDFCDEKSRQTGTFH